MNHYDYVPSESVMSTSSVPATSTEIMMPSREQCLSRSSGSGRLVRSCAVCGDSPAKLHYGTLACFGCKGFFRRAVKEGRNKYVCRYGKNCVVDKYERNSCRYCRFRRCLQVGMNPDAVRPDRDQAKQKLGRTRSKQLQQLIGLKIDKTNDVACDDTAFSQLTSEQKHFLQVVQNVHSSIPKAAKKISVDSVAKFTLKSLINERSLFVAEENKDDYQEISPSASDASCTALWRIVEVVDFVNTICRLTQKSSVSQSTITVEDKIAIVQDIFCRLATFNAVANYLSGMQCELQFFDYLEKLDKNLMRSVNDDLIEPLKRLNLSISEISVLRAIITLDPGIKGIRPAAGEAIHELRSVFSDVLMHVIKDGFQQSIWNPSVNSKFANCFLVFPTLFSIATHLSNHFREHFSADKPIESFASHADILRSLFNPDTTDYLRFPHSNENYFGVTEAKPSEEIVVLPDAKSFPQPQPEVQLVNQPPQITVNNQINPLDNYHWQLSSFASAFSNLQVQTSTAYNPTTQQSVSSPGFASLVANLSPATPAINTSSITTHVSTANAVAAAAALYTNPSNGQPINYDTYHQIYSNGTLLSELPSASSSGFSKPQNRPNTLEIPSTKKASPNPPIGIIPKLPLHLTKSIEEMLRPALPDDASTWKTPLPNDWADKINTPAFNQDVFAKFFPEYALNQNIY